jgi:hypothetical protein
MHPDASYAFIKVLTANLVHDHFRVSRSQKRGGAASTISIDAKGTAELSGSFVNSTILERNVLLQQIDACLRTILPGPNADRDRKIFWLYYRGGLTSHAIGSLPNIGLGEKGVESIILRLTRQIRERLAQAPKESEKRLGTEGIPSADSL